MFRFKPVNLTNEPEIYRHIVNNHGMTSLLVYAQGVGVCGSQFYRVLLLRPPTRLYHVLTEWLEEVYVRCIVYRHSRHAILLSKLILLYGM